MSPLRSPRSRGAPLAALLAAACFSDGGVHATPDPDTSSTSGETSADLPATSTTAPSTSSASTTDAHDTTTTSSSTSAADPDTTDAASSSTGEDCSPTIWYLDADGDTHGSGTAMAGCGPPPPGYAADDDDCDDGEPAVHPGAAEQCDGLDNDCDVGVDEWPAAMTDACMGCAAAESGGHVYYTCDVQTSWAEARTRCQALLADLVILEDAAENQAFLDLQPMQVERVWLGLDDQALEGSFVWVDGAPLDPNAANWMLAEPNNTDPAMPGPADCGSMIGKTDAINQGRWRDASCTVPRNVACEAAGF